MAFRILVLSLFLLFYTGCKKAELINNIVSSQILGSADDADSTTPADKYTGPADLDAVDQNSNASSLQSKYNEVAGQARAEPLDPSANTVTGDMAMANSFNKVVSELQVPQNTTLTFDIELDADDVQLRHNGTVFLQVAAAILNEKGIAVPNGGIANITFDFQRNQNGGTNVVIAGDTANPEQIDTNGNYNRTISGPSGGITLNPGTYRLELDLRIRARAPVLTGDDGQNHYAALKMAKATINLR